MWLWKWQTCEITVNILIILHYKWHPGPTVGKKCNLSLGNMVVLFLIVFFLQTSFIVDVSAFSASPLVAFFCSFFTHCPVFVGLTPQLKSALHHETWIRPDSDTPHSSDSNWKPFPKAESEECWGPEAKLHSCVCMAPALSRWCSTDLGSASIPDRLSHQARISASVNAMRILNTGTEVEAAVADALVRAEMLRSSGSSEINLRSDTNMFQLSCTCGNF